MANSTVTPSKCRAAISICPPRGPRRTNSPLWVPTSSSASSDPEPPEMAGRMWTRSLAETCWSSGARSPFTNTVTCSRSDPPSSRTHPARRGYSTSRRSRISEMVAPSTSTVPLPPARSRSGERRFTTATSTSHGFRWFDYGRSRRQAGRARDEVPPHGRYASPTVAGLLDIAPTQVVELDGPVAYREWPGPSAGGPTFVCVHGLGGSSLNWVSIGPGLSERGRVVALDLAGFGHTPRAGRSSSLSANRRLLSAFIREVAAAPVVLVGNSMGGALAALQAAHEPESIARLVLTSPALPWNRDIRPAPI